MVNEQLIEELVRKRDFSLTDIEVNKTSSKLYNEIRNEKYDFSKYKKDIFTKQGKRRTVYRYSRLSTEDILCQYLKKQLDNEFNIRYASRNRIMNLLFNVLPVVKDMHDFVIIRADFKSFFDSVLTRQVYGKYIQKSMIERYDKELLEEYVKEFKYCYAGLCLSNGMTEIACRDFDEQIKARLSGFGVFFYERYVDDFVIITNKYVSQDDFIEIMNETIKEVFDDSPVQLSMSPEKFTYISKRDMSLNTSERFSFLGYEFEIALKMNQNQKEGILFAYGISEKKRNKYKGVIEKAIIDYKRNKDLELLRQRIKVYSSRVVIGRTIGSSTFDWLTKGVVANYNELQHHIDALLPETKKFMKNMYFDLMKKYKVPIPYFMRQSAWEDSIYNILSNMKRNRTIILQDRIGVSRSVLVKWIKKINPTYNDYGKDYYKIVVDYLDLIKIE